MYWWYRNVISDYHKDKNEGNFASQKVYEWDTVTGEIAKEQVVHIVKPENVGESMCIDEKMINRRYCTIISNHLTGKIALLIDSVKPSFISQSIDLLGAESLKKVKFMNSDMSPSMKKICSEKFPDAAIVVDKFHVIKHILEAINFVRLEIKHQLKQNKDLTVINPNGLSNIQMIDKSRYLLYKMWSELEPDQKLLLENLFAKYPELQKAYELVQQIREWYDKKYIGQVLWKRNDRLREWIIKAKESKIKAFKLIITMFEKNGIEILRYFQKGLTNAKAENLNAKIQRFLANSYGTRDKDFFFYRLQVYFAPSPQKNT